MKKQYAKQLFKIGARKTCEMCGNKKPLKEFMKPSYANYPIENCKIYKYIIYREWGICRLCEQKIADSIAQEFEDDFNDYKNDFIGYIINLGVDVQTAEFEFDAHVESMGISELDLNDGSFDAQECLSCWN